MKIIDQQEHWKLFSLKDDNPWISFILSDKGRIDVLADNDLSPEQAEDLAAALMLAAEMARAETAKIPLK